MENLPQSILDNWLAVIAIVTWSVIWKGIALWKSAQRREIKWFVALLILNTLGLLEILYMFVFSRKSKSAVGPESYADDFPRKRVV